MESGRRQRHKTTKIEEPEIISEEVESGGMEGATIAAFGMWPQKPNSYSPDREQPTTSREIGSSSKMKSVPDKPKPYPPPPPAAAPAAFPMIIPDIDSEPPSPPPEYTREYLSHSTNPSSMDADLYRCLRAGQTDAVRSLIENDVEQNKLLDQLTPQHNTPLHIVANCGGPNDLIDLILDRRPLLLNQGNIYGDCPLHVAARGGHLSAVKHIADCAIDEARLVGEKKNGEGDTALHIALRNAGVGNLGIEMATYLCVNLFHVADLTTSYWLLLNKRDESPLYLAAQLGEVELVKLMLEKSQPAIEKQIQMIKMPVIQAAISGGSLGVLEAILDRHQFLIDSTISIPAEYQFLIHPNIGISGKHEGNITPLSYAAVMGNIEMVRYFMGRFPDCTYKRNAAECVVTFPIHLAAYVGHISVVKEFLKHHPDSRELLTSAGHNILHIASLHGKHDMVKYILTIPDFDDHMINAPDNHGNIPLHHAVDAKYPKVVDAFTWDRRVDLNSVNNSGLTAMDLVLLYNSPVPSLKEELVWRALKYAGAKTRISQLLHGPHGPHLDYRDKKDIKNNYKGQVNTLSVVATLVTTMSFAAGFTMPGGNSGTDPNVGMANFVKRRIFDLFVISNSIALYSSLLNVLVSIFALLGDTKLLQVSLKVAVPMLATSLGAMSISFMSAVYLVVSIHRWLGIVVWILGSVFLLLALALFALLFPKTTARNRFIRYLAYVPFRVMLHFSERDDQCVNQSAEVRHTFTE